MLMFAINEGQMETAAKLIAKGAKLDLQNKVHKSGDACGIGYWTVTYTIPLPWDKILLLVEEEILEASEPIFILNACIRVLARVCARAWVCLSVCLFVNLHVFIHVPVFVSVCVPVCVRVHVFMCVGMCVECVCVLLLEHVYIYIYV